VASRNKGPRSTGCITQLCTANMTLHFKVLTYDVLVAKLPCYMTTATI
jgi:hypothetical protein